MFRRTVVGVGVVSDDGVGVSGGVVLLLLLYNCCYCCSRCFVVVRDVVFASPGFPAKKKQVNFPPIPLPLPPSTLALLSRPLLRRGERRNCWGGNRGIGHLERTLVERKVRFFFFLSIDDAVGYLLGPSVRVVQSRLDLTEVQLGLAMQAN